MTISRAFALVFAAVLAPVYRIKQAVRFIKKAGPITQLLVTFGSAMLVLWLLTFIHTERDTPARVVWAVVFTLAMFIAAGAVLVSPAVVFKALTTRISSKPAPKI